MVVGVWFNRTGSVVWGNNHGGHSTAYDDYLHTGHNHSHGDRNSHGDGNTAATHNNYHHADNNHHDNHTAVWDVHANRGGQVQLGNTSQG
jgi:hypothetical protein